MAIVLIAAAFFGVLTMRYISSVGAILSEENTLEQLEEIAGTFFVSIWF
jgi:hypothetical protein